jgi:hypothetical protein
MKSIKHIGRIQNTGAKVAVVFRTLPGDSNYALVLPTANLPDQYHDALMTVVESDQGQEAFELGEIMHARFFPDGRPMLRAMDADGRLIKVATDTVLMTPTPNDTILLSQLNVLIAEQKNCAVDDLYTFVSGAPKDQPKKEVVVESEIVEEVVDTLQAPDNTALSDKDLAKSYRSQADAMYKEAARLRRQADDLDPPVKKTTTKKVDAETVV